MAEHLQNNSDQLVNRLTRVKHLGNIALNGASKSFILANYGAWQLKKAGIKGRKGIHELSTKAGSKLSPKLAAKRESMERAEKNTRTHRLGRSALKLTQKGLEAITEHSKKQVPKLERKQKKLYTEYDVSNNPFAELANSVFESTDKRKQLYREMARAQKTATHEQKYPEIKEQRIAAEKQKQHDAVQEKRQAGIERIYSLSNQAIDGISDRKIDTFDFSMPLKRESMGYEKLEGDYQDLAESTLYEAIDFEQPDGSLQLIGGQSMSKLIDRETLQGESYTKYLSGVSTLLWKLGFVKYESEDSIARLSGKFNGATEQAHPHQKGVQETFCRIAYDATNELHAIFGAGETPDYIEVKTVRPISNISLSRRSEYEELYLSAGNYEESKNTVLQAA